MARVRKPKPAFEHLLFVTPEQRVLRLLLAEPTTTNNLRSLSSKLKGVRGLGGAEGIQKVLTDVESVGLVNFVDNRRSVRLNDDHEMAQLLKRVAAVCDLESLREILEPLSSKGILFGSRSTGRARSDSDYDIYIVSDSPDEVRRIAEGHPLGKALELVIWSTDDDAKLAQKDPGLDRKLELGISLWGPTR